MSRTLAGIGLKGDYAVGDDDWGPEMDANLLKLSVLLQAGIIGRVAAVPGSPAEGDAYVLTAAPHAQTVAVYDDGAWVYYTPLEGWWVYDRGTNNFIVFGGATWANYVADADLPPGGTTGQVLTKQSGTDGDADWEDPESAGAPTESIIIAVGDETTAITAGVAKVTIRMPYAFVLTAVKASLTTASSSGNPTVDINEGGVTILSTKLSIDSGEKTSATAATAAVISDANLAADAEITIDIDAAGTGATGLKVYLIGHQ
jgi:hypothetical protein